MATPSHNQYEAGADYVLPRDEAEKERLNDQHKYATIVLFESRLIYDRSVVLAPGSNVLDAGTGTGIWLQDLSKQAPTTVNFFGCDVSANNFPTQHADNIHFRVASVTSLPREWSNKFEFVNQRFLVAGLRASEWPTAMSELYRVLRPGGHAQFADFDFEHLVDPGPATRRYMGLLAALFAKAGLSLEGSNGLEGLLKEARFDEVKPEKKYFVVGRAWGKMGELGKQICSRAFRNVGPRMLTYGLIRTEKELHSLVDVLEEEWDSADEGYRVIAHVAIARKPL